MAAAFHSVAILGTGLIGGSFGLAVRQAFPDAHVVGWDRPEVAKVAVSRGAVEAAVMNLGDAVARADLIYVALSIGATLELLPEVARHAKAGALVTDACSVKEKVVRCAIDHFRGATRFLGGHPLAGKELSGIEHADASLFCGAKYALIAAADDSDLRLARFAGLLAALGAEPVWLDAAAHDRAVAAISHLPQLLTVALARVLRNATDPTGLPLALAGPGSRDALRLAGSPYSLWRDICIANRENITAALDGLSQALDHLRTRLTSRELEEEFAVANEVYKTLHQMK